MMLEMVFHKALAQSHRLNQGHVTLVLFKITTFTILLIDMCIQIKIKNKVHKYETETVYANVIL